MKLELSLFKELEMNCDIASRCIRLTTNLTRTITYPLLVVQY